MLTDPCGAKYQANIRIIPTCFDDLPEDFWLLALLMLSISLGDQRASGSRAVWLYMAAASLYVESSFLWSHMISISLARPYVFSITTAIFQPTVYQGPCTPKNEKAAF